jgi:hypothetical protein
MKIVEILVLFIYYLIMLSLKFNYFSFGKWEIKNLLTDLGACKFCGKLEIYCDNKIGDACIQLNW